MVLHGLLGLIIILGCGYLGMLYASRFKHRIKQLQGFQNALSQLEFDINFLNSPLYEAMSKVAKTQNGVVRKIFEYTADKLNKNKGVRTFEIFRNAIEFNRDSLYLTQNDVDSLMEFSKNLGSGDKNSEINNIKVACLRLKVSEEEARGEATRNVKMYKGLGLLLGIFIAIILF